MREVRCLNCDAELTFRSDFDDECYECGASGADLIELDPYGEDEELELVCPWCGWEIVEGAKINWDDDESARFSIDEDCPICDLADFPGRSLARKSSVTMIDLPEYGLAVAAANKVRRAHAGGRIPVDVEQVAAALGLKIARGNWNHDGMLDGTTIEVPPRHIFVERFLIAHEIGHHELRHRGDRTANEPEANAFASELLLPRADLLNFMKSDRPTITGVSRRYEVSRQAAAYAATHSRQINLLSS